MGLSERLKRVEAQIPVTDDPRRRVAAYYDTLPVDVLRALLLALEQSDAPADLQPILGHVRALSRGESPQAPAIPERLNQPKPPFAARVRREVLDREPAVLQELYAIARESESRREGRG